MTASEVQAKLRTLAHPSSLVHSAGFFKTGPGEYAEGQTFLGLRAADLHALSREYRDLPLDQVLILLRSDMHEDRGVALLILTLAFPRANEASQKEIYDLYMANLRYVNNWGLVDVSADHLVGGYLEKRSRKPLYRLARSKNLWERRISIVATLHFIRQGDCADTLALAELLLKDGEDLIHKAAGWMLREVGKRDLPALEGFLVKHCRTMPRTMLRYAIERMPKEKRLGYMKGDLAV